MSRTATISSLTFVLLTLSSLASAATLDQSYDSGSNSSGYFVNSSSPFSQTFTAGLSGQVASVDVRVLNYFGGATDPLQLDLYAIAGPYPEALSVNLASASINQGLIPNSSSFVSFDLSSSGSSFVAGQQYAIVLSTASGFSYLWEGTSSGTYPGGSARQPSGGNLYYTLAGPNFDFSFQTYVNVVPEPSAVMLFGIGLVGILVASRRRKRG